MDDFESSQYRNNEKVWVVDCVLNAGTVEIVVETGGVVMVEISHKTDTKEFKGVVMNLTASGEQTDPVRSSEKMQFLIFFMVLLMSKEYYFIVS